MNFRVDIYSLGCIIYELFTLNEYYSDKVIDEKDCKINIGDFGVSKITTTLNKYTKSQIGKTYYMAPEIVKGLEYNNKVP